MANPSPTSRKGVPNKVTKELKDMILGALEDAGGQEYLRQRALDTPGPFLALISKILPKNIDANISGDVCPFCEGDACRKLELCLENSTNNRLYLLAKWF